MRRSFLTPSRFLFWCALIMAVIITILIYDTIRECDQDELQAARRLLDVYSSKIQEIQNDQAILKTKIEQAEQELTMSSQQSSQRWVKGLPVIYLITPTYTRMEQKAELTRLSYTFLHIQNIHWIVVEDSEFKTELVKTFLSKAGLNYTHLNVATPPEYKMKSSDPNWLKPRGVLQRNLGLQWLRENVLPLSQPGVLYFADDDNTYSLRLFDEMRFTHKVSIWPVGLVGYLRYESPVVKNNKVVSWFTYFKPTRPFPMDMAGFAVNLDLLRKHPEAGFSNQVLRGYQESHFLTALQVALDDLEPKANMCTEVLVWHTRTEKSKLKNEDKMMEKYGVKSDLSIEV